jgi:hypothetical protein
MMLTCLYRSPDSDPAAATPAPKAPSRVKNFLPQGQIDLATLGVNAAAKYAAEVTATPAFGLIWTKPADFTALAVAAQAKVAEAGTTQANRTPNADVIDGLDEQINQRLPNLRTYLSNAYEDTDPAIVRGYLGQLGFVLQHGSYLFPKGQQERLTALNTLLSGLTTHGLGTRKYGLTFWTGLRDKYKLALQAAGTGAGTASTVVDQKNELLDQLREVLTALYYLLRAQYPKGWKAKLRAYGYQKERYS